MNGNLIQMSAIVIGSIIWLGSAGLPGEMAQTYSLGDELPSCQDFMGKITIQRPLLSTPCWTCTSSGSYGIIQSRIDDGQKIFTAKSPESTLSTKLKRLSVAGENDSSIDNARSKAPGGKKKFVDPREDQVNPKKKIRLFRTEWGSIGWAPHNARLGDLICQAQSQDSSHLLIVREKDRAVEADTNVETRLFILVGLMCQLIHSSELALERQKINLCVDIITLQNMSITPLVAFRFEDVCIYDLP
jgi:hypothetical protein